MQKARGRQKPSSCQSCRTKKLKCDRVQPCSNCAARRIECTFLVPPHSQKTPVIAGQSNAMLLRRLERLESLLVQKHPDAAPDSCFPDELPLPKHQGDPKPSPDGLVHNTVLDSDRDSRYLESIGTREDSLVRDGSEFLRPPQVSLTRSQMSSWSDGLAFGLGSTQDILQNSTAAMLTAITFPTHKVAFLLYQNYESHLDNMCKIIHLPSLRSMIDSFYLRLHRAKRVSLGQAALLLSLFALSAFFYPPSCHSEVARQENEPASLSKIFGKSALDVLDHCRRMTSGTLEEVQAYLMMAYVTFQNDGFSARGRSYLMAAASIGRDLGLHRIDADGGSDVDHQLNARARVDREVKRRVFWYLASADW